MDRRYFLMGAAAAVTAGKRVLPVPTTLCASQSWVGGRGGSHLREWTTLPNVELVAISDIDQSHMASFVKRVESSGKKRRRPSRICARFSTTSPSTPSPSPRRTIGMLCRPSGRARRARTFTWRAVHAQHLEAKQIVAAARKYDRMVQQGSQSRSSEALQEGVQKMREGSSATSTWPRAVLQDAQHHWTHTGLRRARGRGLRPVDRTCAETSVHEERFHYNWHWFWDTGDGDIGNQAFTRWTKRAGAWASSIRSRQRHRRESHVRRRPGDPNVLNASFEFNENGKTKILEFEVRHWITNREYMSRHWSGAGAGRGTGGGMGGGGTIGNLYYGSNGYW